MRRFFITLTAIFSLVSCVTEEKKPTLVITPHIKIEQKISTVESIVHEQGKAVVLIVTYDESGNALKLGSGFFVKADGVFITNYHVIEGAYSAAVKLTDGRVLNDITIVDFNSEWDIAILRVKGGGFPLQGLSITNAFRILIDIYKEQLISIGYPEKELRMAASNKDIYSGLPTVPIKNTKNVDLYVLILASKHELAQKIWNSIIRIGPDGQKKLF